MASVLALAGRDTSATGTLPGRCWRGGQRDAARRGRRGRGDLKITATLEKATLQDGKPQNVQVIRQRASYLNMIGLRRCNKPNHVQSSESNGLCLIVIVGACRSCYLTTNPQ
eukprot:6201133-Pleurochrysis_carterae.AAC.5